MPRQSAPEWGSFSFQVTLSEILRMNTEFSFSSFIKHGLEDTVRTTYKVELFLYHTAQSSSHV